MGSNGVRDHQQAEFPDNSVVRFRGGIPGGLDLRRGEWEVGLTSLFLPGPVKTVTPPSDVRTIIDHATICTYGHQYGPKEPTGKYTRKQCTIAKDWIGPAALRTKGVDYIKTNTDSVEQRLLHELPLPSDMDTERDDQWQDGKEESRYHFSVGW